MLVVLYKLNVLLIWFQLIRMMEARASGWRIAVYGLSKVVAI